MTNHDRAAMIVCVLSEVNGCLLDEYDTPEIMKAVHTIKGRYRELTM